MKMRKKFIDTINKRIKSKEFNESSLIEDVSMNPPTISANNHKKQYPHVAILQ